MARYGIVSRKVLGVSIAQMRPLAKEIGKDHSLALRLWRTGIFEARLLAIFIEDPLRVTASQMERWAKDFDNWAICDGCCLHLFRSTPFAWKKALAWSTRPEEFVRRAAFSLMAVLTVHEKRAPDRLFRKLLPLIRKAAADERNGVKKAVSWALRVIGKRNISLNKEAVATARRLKSMRSPSARWIGSDALRELTSRSVAERYLNRKAKAKR